MNKGLTPEQFYYWMQGYSEVSDKQPTAEQWKVIQDHLKTVFHKVTPQYSPNDWSTNPNTFKVHPQPDPITFPKIIC